MGTPARIPAEVVPAPPWWTTARHMGKTAAWLTARTTLTWSPCEAPAEVGCAGADQGPLAQLRARRADHGDGRCGGFDRHAAETEVDGRGPRGDPRHDVVVGARGQLHGERSDKRTPPAPFRRHFGKAELVVGLQLQRPAFHHALRRRPSRLRQAQFPALRVLRLLGQAPIHPACRRHPGADQRRRHGQRQRRDRDDVAVDPLRERVQRGDRNVVILRDVGRDLLVRNAGQQQVGPVRDRRQHAAGVRPAPGDRLHGLAKQRDRVLDLPRVAEQSRIHQLHEVRSVGNRGQPGRLDELQQVRGRGHDDVVSPPLQFQPDGGAGLDIAASAVTRQGKLHDRVGLSRAPGAHQSLTKW